MEDPSETHIGKVQFLRLEHGYLRSKTKIHGIRDIIFYYKDLDEELMTILVVGTIIAFEVVRDDSGKLIATSIKLIKLPEENSSVSAPENSCVQNNSESDSSNLDDIDNIGSSSSKKETVLTIHRTPATIHQYFNIQCEKSSNKEYQDMKTQECSDFNTLVNIFLERVITGEYDHYNTSCWLS